MAGARSFQMYDAIRIKTPKNGQIMLKINNCTEFSQCINGEKQRAIALV